MEKELFVCPVCGHAYETDEYRVENLETESNKISTCPICNRKIYKRDV